MKKLTEIQKRATGTTCTENSYTNIRKELEEKLFSILKLNNDPRLTEKPCRFEHEPYAGPLSKEQIPDPGEMTDIVLFLEGEVVNVHSRFYGKTGSTK